MVADFVSANYGWLHSPDDILWQAMHAMDILQEHYPSEKHVFVFDNAMTHLKWADNALSTHKCLSILPGMAVTGKSWSWSLMVKGNQCLTQMGRPSAKLSIWGMPHLWMAGCSAYIFPKIIQSHPASSKGWP